MQFSTQDPFENKVDQINQHLFRLLLDFKDYAIIMLNQTGHIISWNPGAANVFGYTTAEALGQRLTLFYPAEALQAGAAELALQKAKEKGRVEAEGWLQRKDGTRFFANAILTGISNEDSSFAGFAMVTRDITLQQQLAEENQVLHENLEEKVRQRTAELAVANKELEAFSYSVSHDLRAPLRAIGGYARILQEDYEPQLDAEGKRVINVILDNAKMMGELIDDLLTFSKMSRLEAIYESIDMSRMAKACADAILQTEKPDRYSLTIQALPPCKGDPSMLRQVWINLIGNAVKYSSRKSNPQIEIGMVSDPAANIYFVKDNGAGFDMKYYNKLFGVFQRLHRQDEFEGTGLGLALAKRIVSKHGGEIWGAATLDGGATFYFSIPK